MLEIRSLSKTYANGVQALRDVTLDIPRGMFGLETCIAMPIRSTEQFGITLDRLRIAVDDPGEVIEKLVFIGLTSGHRSSPARNSLRN